MAMSAVCDNRNLLSAIERLRSKSIIIEEVDEARQDALGLRPFFHRRVFF
jgi:hypothetical protein